MATFLPKEQVRLQSIGKYSPSTVAKDFATLFSTIGQAGKTIQTSMAKDSEIAGKLVARDKLIELKQQETQSIEEKNKQGVDNFDYEAEKNNFDLSVSNALRDTQDKFGKDSTAYKSFEKLYLLNATNISESYKTSLEKERYKVAQDKIINTTNEQQNTLANNAKPEVANSFRDSLNSAGQDDSKVSRDYSNMLIGKFNSDEINYNEVLDGDKKIDRNKVIKLTEHYFGAVASMDKEGNLIAKNKWIQQEDLGKIKKNIIAKLSNFKKKVTGVNGAYADVYNATSKLLTNSSTMTSDDIQQNLSKIENAYNEADNLGETNINYAPITPQQKLSFREKVNNIKNMYYENKELEDILFVRWNNAVHSGNMKTWMSKGMDIAIPDANLQSTTGDYTTKHINGSKISQMVKTKLENKSTELLEYNLDISDGNSMQDFTDKLMKLKVYETATGITTSFSKHFGDMAFADKSTIVTTKDFNKLHKYADYMANKGIPFWQDFIKSLDVISKSPKGKDETDFQTSLKITNALNSEKATKNEKERSRETDKIINTSIDYINGAKGFFNTRFFETATVQGQTSALKSFMVANRSTISARDMPKYIKKNFQRIEVGDDQIIGTNYGVIVPDNVKERVVLNSIEKMVKQYNIDKFQDLDMNKIEPRLAYDKNTNSFIIRIFDDTGKGNFIGEINMNNQEFLKSKTVRNTEDISTSEENNINFDGVQ